MVDKKWTLEEAQAENEAALLNDPARITDPTLPLFQWIALHELEQLSEQYEQGNQFALMLAIRVCANHDLIMPRWVGDGYIAAFDTILNYRSGSWDDVFGRPIPKNAHLSALKKKRNLEFAVFNEIVRIRQCERNSCGAIPPLDAWLFERVGKPFGIGKTLAEEYYYGVLKKAGHKPQ